MTRESQSDFLSALIQRGLGIYGKARMGQICQASKIRLLEEGGFEWLGSDHDQILQAFILNYSKLNVPAKMTALVLAKKHGIPLPEAFQAKKKRSRLRKLLKKR
ncbi:MAG: hypothetical protein ACFFBD_10220 [Candidatus Hodarchaeota archaeon]